MTQEPEYGEPTDQEPEYPMGSDTDAKGEPIDTGTEQPDLPGQAPEEDTAGGPSPT